GPAVTCYALSRQSCDFGRLQVPRLLSALRLSVLSFAVHGVADGLIVPPANIFPARYVNTEAVFQLTGVPIELWRGLAGLAITYFVIRMLEMFDIEHARPLEEAGRGRGGVGGRGRV